MCYVARQGTEREILLSLHGNLTKVSMELLQVLRQESERSIHNKQTNDQITSAWSHFRSEIIGNMDEIRDLISQDKDTASKALATSQDITRDWTLQVEQHLSSLEQMFTQANANAHSKISYVRHKFNWLG